MRGVIGTRHTRVEQSGWSAETHSDPDVHQNRGNSAIGRRARLADSPAASAAHMPVPGVAAMEVDEEAHSTTSSGASTALGWLKPAAVSAITCHALNRAARGARARVRGSCHVAADPQPLVCVREYQGLYWA